MAGNKYSKLLIDQSKIYSWITTWCEENLEGTFEIQYNDTTQRISYSIVNVDTIIKIDFIKAKGGALTIYPNVGKNTNISEMIAEYVYKRVTSNMGNVPFANGFSIKMDYESFNILIELLKEYDNISVDNYSKSNDEGKAAYELYKLKSTLGDTVVIKYYFNTKRVQVQGKPLYLFNEITSLICESGNSADDVVDAHIELCHLKVTRNELNNELLDLLGTDLYDFMTVTHRAMLNTSIVLSKIKVDGLDDYSYIIQQALRSYEGLTLKMMSNKGCILPKRKQIGEFFIRQNVNDDFKMKNIYCSGLNVVDKDLFEKMYNFFSSKRHPYMHSTDSDSTTTIIGTYEGAIERLEEIITNMKMCYSSYK